ncbi:MAG TPA: PRC-barrel domain-containing protein [Steroidobacteraceae bacterium]
MEINYVSRDTYGIYKREPVGGTGPSLMGADTLLGNDVYNGIGDKLGSIAEVMLEMNTGRVSYAVLSFGGFLGLGERLFAVPWRCLKLDAKHHRFLLNVPKEALRHAPCFEKGHWPSMADPAWEQGITKFYASVGSEAEQ